MDGSKATEVKQSIAVSHQAMHIDCCTGRGRKHRPIYRHSLSIKSIFSTPSYCTNYELTIRAQLEQKYLPCRHQLFATKIELNRDNFLPTKHLRITAIAHDPLLAATNKLNITLRGGLEKGSQ